MSGGFQPCAMVYGHADRNWLKRACLLNRLHPTCSVTHPGLPGGAFLDQLKREAGMGNTAGHWPIQAQ